MTYGYYIGTNIVDGENMKAETSKLMWRVVAGLLAVFSMVLVIMRLFGYSLGGEEMASDSVMGLLRLLFPLAVAVMSGYIAVKGRIPFTAM